MATTIKDIARRLNISVSTVSYALNGGPRPVPTEVRDKVFSVARELNYRPNRVARSMITGRSHTIGIVPPEMTENLFLSPYLHLALNGIANEAGRLHEDILLFTRYNETDSDEMLSVLVDGRIDGAIFIAPHFSAKTVEIATALHLPCAVVSGAPLAGLTCFSVNNEGGMHQALQHLYDLGHRKIGHIAGRRDMQDAILRLHGYESFLAAKGLPFHPEWVFNGNFEISGGRLAMRSLLELEDPPTAITCANDEMAIGALVEALDRGIKVPGDISIVGFDAAPGGANVYPALTSIRQPIGEVGAAAVRALGIMIEGGKTAEHTVFDTELIVRASTSRPKEDLP